MQRHCYFEMIMFKNPSVQSRAAYVLLARKLKTMDRTKNWEKNPNFRKEFLDKFVEKHGELYCEYCGLRNLVRKVTKQSEKLILATLDHIVPLSRGGSEFDISNIKLCCQKCNTLKGDMRVKEFERSVK